MSIPEFPDKNKIEIPPSYSGKKEAFQYIINAQQRWAIKTALATKRPLLITGEPGIGKSHLALAAAAALQWKFEYEAISARTEAEQLLFDFDAVGRLAAAQVQQSLEEAKENLKEERFLRPGCLWRAINPKLAAHYPVGEQGAEQECVNHEAHKGTVLLLDEIDKADAEVPNSILDVIDSLSFDCRYVTARKQKNICLQEGREAPLVIFTTNGERDLPAAFIRRCIVLGMSVEDQQLASWAMERAQGHFSEDHKVVTSEVIEAALSVFIEDRKNGSRANYKPGLAEFLDLLYAVAELCQTPEDAKEKLSDIREFVTQKHEQMS